MNIANFVSSHWAEILAALYAAEKLARVLVNLTPSTADNAVLDKVTSFLNFFASVKPKS